MVTHVLWTAESVSLRKRFSIVLETRVHLDLTWFHLCEFSVFFDVGWSASIARLFEWEYVWADTVVSVVTSSSDEFACIADGWNWVGSDLITLVGSQSRNHSFK